jgi:hypothetical protein
MQKISINAIKLMLDSIIAVAMLALISMHITGVAIHEWLGIAIVFLIVIHLLLSWDWIVATSHRFFRVIPHRVRINYLLNAMLFIAVTVMIFSGVMISKVALPFLGLRPNHDPFFRMLHTLFGEVLLWLVGLHLAMNWKWVTCVLRKYIIIPLRRQIEHVAGLSSRIMPPVNPES